MDLTTILLIAGLIGLGAALYTAIGHGGASAYLAVMALFSIPVAVMKPSALVLNLIASAITAARFIGAKQFNPRLFLIFAAPAIPIAFLGGRFSLPPEYYRPLVGALLWAAAARLLWPKPLSCLTEAKPPSALVAAPMGGGLGLLAGLTGTGGGIFLSPLILLLGWEEPRKTSGVAAAFIFVNSAAGLAGNLSSLQKLPPELPWWIAAVLVGAVAGTSVGVSRLPRKQLLQVLGLVLTIAGAKLIFS